MAFPTGLSLLDDFTRADANPISGSWARLAILGSNDLQLSSNQVTSGGFALDAGSYWTGATYGDDNGCFVTVATKSANGDGMCLTVRGSNLNNAGTCSLYQLLVTPNSGTDAWQIDKVVTGVYTPSLAVGSQEVSNGDKIGIGVVGTTITAYYNSGSGWTSVCSVSDGSVSTGGQLSLHGTSTLFRFDDFTGGTLTATSPPVANFTGTPTTLSSGGSVVFTDSSTNTPTSWLWEKNSGSGWVNFAGSPTSQNPTETFS